MKLSVVVPTLNAERTLARCLQALGDVPVVVADGGSQDGTRALAETLGARVVCSEKGRGVQLRSGAEAALADGAEAFLFLHADTVLAPDWRNTADAFLAQFGAGERAGYFSLAFDDDAPQARRIARLANWRARRLGLPYGDQGLLIGVGFYQLLGGFRDLPLMEDVDLVRRIGRRRLIELPAYAVTSAERYRRDGWVRRPLRNLGCLALYFAGVPPRHLQRLYSGGRAA